MNVHLNLATHTIPLWFLVLSLFLPRICIVVAWFQHSMVRYIPPRRRHHSRHRRSAHPAPAHPLLDLQRSGHRPLVPHPRHRPALRLGRRWLPRLLPPPRHLRRLTSQSALAAQCIPLRCFSFTPEVRFLFPAPEIPQACDILDRWNGVT